MGVGTRNLGGKEDLLLGQGQVEQDRDGALYTITKINANHIPYSGDDETDDMISVKQVIDGLIASSPTDTVVEW
jgi:hypothetical protein